MEREVLKRAFCRAVESVAYWLGHLPGSPRVPDGEMARVKADVARELLRHPCAIDLMDDLAFRRALKRFRSLNVGRASLDQRPVVEHLLAVELTQARETVSWQPEPLDAA